jgi:glutamate mutase epsilon subunit
VKDTNFLRLHFVKRKKINHENLMAFKGEVLETIIAGNNMKAKQAMKVKTFSKAHKSHSNLMGTNDI